MKRFLAIALPLLLLTMALFRFALELLRMAPDPAALSRSGIVALPAAVTLATWVLEAVGLAALYLLIQGRGASRWHRPARGLDRLGLPRSAAGGDRGRAGGPGAQALVGVGLLLVGALHPLRPDAGPRRLHGPPPALNLPSLLEGLRPLEAVADCAFDPV